MTFRGHQPEPLAEVVFDGGMREQGEDKKEEMEKHGTI